MILKYFGMCSKKFFLTAVFTFVSLVLSGKVNVGIEVMPQFSNRLSWEAGINLEIPVGDRFYLYPGLSYSSRHRYNQSLIETMEYHPEGDIPVHYEKASFDVKGDYLNIPFLVGFRSYEGSVYSVKVAGGVYFAYCLDGKSTLKLDDNGNETELYSSYKYAIAKRADYGLCLDVNYLLHRHYQIGLNLQQGLRKIYSGFDVERIDDPRFSHSLGPGVRFHQSIGLTIGYLF